MKRLSSRALEESSRPFKDSIWSLAVQPDGKTVVTGGRYPPRLRIWDLTRKSPIDPIGVLHEFAFTMAYSPDGRILATTHADRPTVRVWDMTNPRSPKQQHEIENATRAAFSADGKTLATGGNGVVQLWDLSGGAPRKRSAIRADTGAVLSIDFSPANGEVVIGYERGYVLLADAMGTKVRDWQFDHAANVRFTPEGGHLLTQNSNATSYILRLSEDGPK